MDVKIIAGLVVFTILVIIFYNRLVRLRYAGLQSWSDNEGHYHFYPSFFVRRH